MTVTEICQVTGLKRTPYLLDLLNEMVAHGFIVKRLVKLPDGHLATEYWTGAAPDEKLLDGQGL